MLQDERRADFELGPDAVLGHQSAEGFVVQALGLFDSSKQDLIGDLVGFEDAAVEGKLPGRLKRNSGHFVPELAQDFLGYVAAVFLFVRPVWVRLDLQLFGHLSGDACLCVVDGHAVKSSELQAFVVLDAVVFLVGPVAVGGGDATKVVVLHVGDEEGCHGVDGHWAIADDWRRSGVVHWRVVPFVGKKIWVPHDEVVVAV